jgi:dipeptidyl aminopeptidase/acylaminoacyl peptidase
LSLLDDVAVNRLVNIRDGVATFALSAGTLVFLPEAPAPRRTVVWADRSGDTTPLPLELRTYWTPRLSPDGRQFAVVIDQGGRRNISIYRFDTRTLSAVTFDGDNWAPVWTRDGSRLAYLSRRDSVRHLMWQPVDANSPPESLASSRDDDLVPAAWSIDGRSLIYVNIPPNNNSDLRVLDIATRKVNEIPGMPARVTLPVLSPDGRWLAFSAFPGGMTGRPSIYLQSFPGPGPVQRIVEGAGAPLWSRDGKSLFFRSRRGSDSTLLADGIFEVAFDPSRGMPIGASRQLFRKPHADWLGVQGYDVATDGRFLMVLLDDSESVPRDFHVLLHVDDELKRRVP